jgi:hypothetical protein
MLRRLIRRILFSRRLFRLLDRHGVHLLPKHYYGPVPDYAWLEAHPTAWRRRIELGGVEWNLDDQLSWLEGICRDHHKEVIGSGWYANLSSAGFGWGYGLLEGQVLHCFIRACRPARICEIAGGVSTAVMARATAMNAAEGGGQPRITTIEPYAWDGIRALEGVEVVAEQMQLVDGAVFASLQAGDLLFIDSTHVLKTGSELHRLYLEIVPALPAGVVVHVHDVTLPYLYQRTFGRDFFDWQETALVLALLTHNSRLRPLCCLSALHYDRPDELRRILPDYRRQNATDGLAPFVPEEHFPSALWLLST